MNTKYLPDSDIIAVHRDYIRITNSINAGLLLSQCVYWSRRTKDADGWFYKTASHWHDEICLSRRELENARSILIRLNLIETELRGVPAKTHYRILSDNIHDLLHNLQIAQKRQSVDFSQYGGNVQTRLAESAITDCTKPPNCDGGNVQTITKITQEIKQEITTSESEANASGADAPKIGESGDDDQKDALALKAAAMWKEGLAKLIELGAKENSARSLMGKLVKTCGPDALIRALDALSREEPVNPLAYLRKATEEAYKREQAALNMKSSGHVATFGQARQIAQLEKPLAASNRQDYYIVPAPGGHCDPWIDISRAMVMEGIDGTPSLNQWPEVFPSSQWAASLWDNRIADLTARLLVLKPAWSQAQAQSYAEQLVLRVGNGAFQSMKMLPYEPDQRPASQQQCDELFRDYVQSAMLSHVDYLTTCEKRALRN